MSNSRRKDHGADSGDDHFIDDSSLDVDQAILVCKVREDGELAQRLQKEEEDRHYTRNIEIRHLAAHDLRKAKELQEEEDRLHREWILKKEDEDRRRAAYLQQKIYRKELEDRHQKENITKRDEREARKLAAEDEKIKKLEKLQVINDRKMAEQLVAKMNINQCSDHHSKDEQYARNLAKSEEAERSRTEQEIIDFQKAALLQDEELARHIHEEEMREAEGEFPPHPKAGSSKHTPSKKSSHGNSKKLANISSQQQKVKKVQQQQQPTRPPPPNGGLPQRQYSNNRDKQQRQQSVDNGAAAADPRPPSRPTANPNNLRHSGRGDRRQQLPPNSSHQQPSSSSGSGQSRNGSLYGHRLHDNDKDLPIDEDQYQESYARFVSSNSAERPRDYDDRRGGGGRRKNKGEKNENCKQQ